MTRFRGAVILAVSLSVGGFCGCSSNSTTPLGPPNPPMTVYEAGSSGVSLPILVREVQPAYTADAIGNRVQGAVLLAAVVLPNGTVGEVTVLRSLDTRFGLDAQ